MRKLTIAELNFNPRSHERSDHSIICFSNLMQGFQSTLPREERPIQSSLMVTKYDFNPRSHERSDIEAAAKTAIMGISIHAPTRGATVKKQLVNHARIISIHAPTRGATVFECLGVQTFEFQSTLPREERLLIAEL